MQLSTLQPVLGDVSLNSSQKQHNNEGFLGFYCPLKQAVAIAVEVCFQCPGLDFQALHLHIRYIVRFVIQVNEV